MGRMIWCRNVFALWLGLNTAFAAVASAALHPVLAHPDTAFAADGDDAAGTDQLDQLLLPPAALPVPANAPRLVTWIIFHAPDFRPVPTGVVRVRSLVPRGPPVLS